MKKIIQIEPARGGLVNPTLGDHTLWALCEDGSVWKLYQNVRGEIWVPLRAASHSAVSTLKETASGDK